MSNELALPMRELEAMAKVMSKLFRKNPDDLMALMLLAQAEGKHPAIAAQEYDIIQGQPALNSKSALARFQAAGGKIKWTERTDTKASAVFSHPAGGDLEIVWTIERAQKAGLAGKDNWKKIPAQMLSARVVAEGVRAVFPACLSGLYTVEEVQDFDEEKPAKAEPRNVTPAERPAAAAVVHTESTDPEALKFRGDVLAYVTESTSVMTDEEKNELRAMIKAAGIDREKLESLRFRAEQIVAAKPKQAVKWEVVDEPEAAK